MKNALGHFRIIRCVNFLTMVGIFSNASAFGAGVAAVKEYADQADSAANPVVYQSIVLSSGPLLRIINGSKEFSLERVKVASKVDVPSFLPSIITDEEEMAPLRRSLAELKAFAKRYPKSAPILEPHIAALNGHVAKFESGFIRYRGGWITEGDYKAILKSNQEETDRLVAQSLAQAEEYRKEQVAAAEKSRQEQAKADAFAVKQKSKGLELYRGEWMPRAKVAKLQKSEEEGTAAWGEVVRRSLANETYSVIKALDAGLLIEFESDEVKKGGLNSGVAFLFGVAKGTAAEGDFYKSTCYWCGTYTLDLGGGDSRTVHAYCLNKDYAINRVRTSMRNDAVAEQGEKTQDGNHNENSDGAADPLADATRTGSGFFVGSDGYFVTNDHVVEGANTVSVYFGGKMMNAEVVKVSKVGDLALLKVDGIAAGLTISAADPEPGQEVFAVGFPQPSIQGIEPKVTKGIISSTKGLGDDDTQLQIDAAVQPGNSGGPLCDSSGHLVGVVVSGLNQIAVAKKTGSIPQNVNYAIKSSEVSALLRSKSVKAEIAVDASKSDSTVQAVKIASASTGLVVIK